MFCTYVLVKEAEYWWENIYTRLETEGHESFKRVFLDKYFLEDVRDKREKKEKDFLELKQGNSTMSEYATKFEDLSKYYPY
ncbi:hypothetical protein CR513_05318, partial [Mucuna pruriens]